MATGTGTGRRRGVYARVPENIITKLHVWEVCPRSGRSFLLLSCVCVRESLDSLVCASKERLLILPFMRSAPFQSQHKDQLRGGLDKASQQWNGTFCSQPLHRDVGSPGQCLQKSTLWLGSGTQYDHAEAARVAAAERNSTSLAMAYPGAKHGAKTTPAKQEKPPSAKKGMQDPSPISLEMKEGGKRKITVNLFNSSPTSTTAWLL